MGDWRRFCREMELAAAVTREDVTRVASVYLRRDNLTVGTFVPEGDGATGLPLAPGPLPSC
jgi:predicted Zn-dependent peptidase